MPPAIINVSSRLERLQASPIRDILAVAQQPGMISFAGGLPAAKTFPAVESLVFEQDDLQYGPSEGEPRLRQLISDDLHRRGMPVSPDHVLIVSGSQQGIDLVAKLVIDQGDTVAVESPTYLAALQVFSLFGASYAPFRIDALQAIIASKQPKLLYTIPTFQNPSSQCYTLKQRKALARLCDERHILLFEDDPYRELQYGPCETQPVASFVNETSWVYQSSFSKTMAPGMRLGYLACSADLYPWLLRLKQAADLHSSRISQRIVQHLLTDENAVERTESLRRVYKTKRDAFQSVLLDHFQNKADWLLPQGGLFFWLQLKTAQPVRTMDMLAPAIDAGVAFMPGEPFFADGRHASSCIRLNFSNADVADFDRGLALLSAIVEQGIRP